jgi:hypothetical protein
MDEENLGKQVFQKMQAWVDVNFLQKSGLLGSIGSSNWLVRYKRFVRDSSIKWDEYLNQLDIKRIEHHLDRKPREGNIRIRDPFALGTNSRRDLEMPLETANKIVFMGMP